MSDEWTMSFLNAMYSERCSIHANVQRNEKDHFCINCAVSICQFCIEGGMHLQHKIIKIYKHVYNDVVSLTAMQKHMDCSKIQPYRSNKRLVLALRALPHSGSGSRLNLPGCQTCQRKINHPETYNYCSIYCQVVALSSDSNSNAAAMADPGPSVQDLAAEGLGWQGSGSRTSRKKRTKFGFSFIKCFF